MTVIRNPDALMAEIRAQAARVKATSRLYDDSLGIRGDGRESGLLCALSIITKYVEADNE